MSVKTSTEQGERLLLALAEQLKLPLMQIARRAEWQARNGLAAYHEIASTADRALRLIDGYILSVTPDQVGLALEPVSVSAILQDTAHQLSQLAKQYNCEVHLNLAGKYGPVMADKQCLEAALMLLGYSFIESQTSSQEQQPAKVVLAAHKSTHGLVAGIFGSSSTMTSDAFRRAKALYGTARQPLTNIGLGGAGIFIADSLLKSMHTPLHAARHQTMHGLAATLIQSQQLSLLKA